MTSELDAALAVDLAVRRRAAAEAISVPEGVVVRHPELYDVHYLNAVVIGAAQADRLFPAEVVALAERWLGAMGHRHVVFEDEAAGERAAAQLSAEGWERRRTSLMALAVDAAPVRPPADVDPRARRITDGEMETLQLAALREEIPQAHLRTGLAERLVATQRALRAGTPAQCHGAGEGGQLQSMCTLFLDEDVGGRRIALLEEVGTLLGHRRRGLARAAVGAAIAAARTWQAELIVVPADADDWPQLMYTAMGFDSAGRQVSLTLRVPGGRPGPAGSGSVADGL